MSVPVRPASAVDVGVLGPVEVRLEGASVKVGGTKRRGLLALLTVHAGDVVALGDIVEALWGPDAPGGAGHVVQTYVSSWRRVLGPDRIDYAGGGYRLNLSREESDLGRFTRDCATGRRLAGAGRSVEAAATFAAALTHWRGPALADLAGEPFHAATARRLVEARLQAAEDYATATLAGDAPASDVVTVLHDLRAAEPLREKLTELLMWALARDGRQADALGVFTQTSELLADELGADPGPALRAMHARVLRQDPALVRGRVVDVRPYDPAPPATSSEPPEPRAPLITADAEALPVLTDSFVGRDADVRRVRDLVGRHRFVTLVGPGGSGKSRLAVEAARDTGSVCYVDAGPLRSATMLTDRVAASLRVHPGARTPLEALAAVVGTDPVLVVIDEVEHLPDVAGVLTRLLAAVPGMRVLVTSREPTRARGEHLHPVGPLPLAPVGGGPSPAVELFLDRARATDPDLPSADDPDFADLGRVLDGICARLDGLPLALELAAGWMRVLRPADLLTRLDHRLDLLVEHGGAGDRPDRQRTLRAALDGSYQLLSETDKAFFRALSTFRGSWTPEAAAAVFSAELPASAGPPTLAVLEHIARLRDKSLLERTARRDSTDGVDRFSFLETVREFAAERLAEDPDAESVAQRHADHVLALVARETANPDVAVAYARLELEHDDVVAVLTWLGRRGLTDTALRAAGSLWRFWSLRSHLAEGEELLTALLAAPGDAGTEAWATAQEALGGLAYWRLDYATATRHYTQALRASGDLGSIRGEADAHYDLGYLAHIADEPHRARRHFEDALHGYRALDDDTGQANVLVGFALLHFAARRWDAVEQLLSTAIAHYRDTGQGLRATSTLSLLASARRAEGAGRVAGELLRECLSAHRRAGNRQGMAWMLHELAVLALDTGEASAAAHLAGAAHALTEQFGGVPAIVPRLPALESVRVRCAADIGDDAADRAWRAGHGSGVEEAVGAALAV